MKKISLATIPAALLSIPAAAISSGNPVLAERIESLMGREPAPKIEYVENAPVRPFRAQSSKVSAAFTVRGEESLAPVYEESFDAGFGSWRIDASDENVTWTVKDMGDAKSFSNVRPGDISSLYVDGPYQTFKRAKSSVVSSAVQVPMQGVLTFYAGYSLNYNDVASLTLSLRPEGEEEFTPVWRSIDETGEKPWAWRPVTIDLTPWEGQEVVLRFEYGPGTSDLFQTGGYLGDFAIDGIAVSGLQEVGNQSLVTGDRLSLVSISSGPVVAYEWSMPGAVPSSSSEPDPEIYYTADGTYDISLTVTDDEGNISTVTRPGFVTVIGTAPVARILPPATFLSAESGKPLVAPLADVTFRDASTGFPTSRSWTFMHAAEDAEAVVTSEEENPTVSFLYLHDKLATLEVANSHGTSAASCEVTAEYSGRITNIMPGTPATTFDMGDWGVFPGSNTRNINAYAERFSAPSVPMMVEGVYVYFNKAQAEELADQIANVGVHLYTSKDGLPDRRLDSMWWSVFELDTPVGGELAGTPFPFTENPIVDGEFFIVVDGIPEFSETCCVSFGMRPFTDSGNTVLFRRGDEWISADSYFPAGANHTSLMVYPVVSHSVMKSLAAGDEVVVGPEAGTIDCPIFSYLGYSLPGETDADWVRTVGEPNGMTVDDLHLQYDSLPAGIEERRATVTVTDGATLLPISIVQQKGSGVRTVGSSEAAVVEVYSLSGILLWQGASSEIPSFKEPVIVKGRVQM